MGFGHPSFSQNLFSTEPFWVRPSFILPEPVWYGTLLGSAILHSPRTFLVRNLFWFWPPPSFPKTHSTPSSPPQPPIYMRDVSATQIRAAAQASGCKRGLAQRHVSFVFLFVCVVRVGGASHLHAPQAGTLPGTLPMPPWFVCTSTLADLWKSGNQCFLDFPRCSKSLDVEVAWGTQALIWMGMGVLGPAIQCSA